MGNIFFLVFSQLYYLSYIIDFIYQIIICI